jgi:alpha-1,2-mannosyltransferase
MHVGIIALPVRSQRERRRLGAALRDPLVLMIAGLTLVGLGLRLLYLLHHGYLLGLTEYDDGAYFGSAVRLTQGILPYRDFALVHPPAITLLMVPSALLAKVAGTSTGLASARILEVLAGTASIPMTGLLVRHRGALAVVISCGLMAVYPEAIAASHTVLLEPWLVLFTLAGAALLFDGDQLTASRRRLTCAGVALGLAGAVEAWAVIPAAILLVLCLTAPPSGRSRLKWAATFAGGMAGGFLVTVAPFALAAPTKFYQDVVLAQAAQISPRLDASRVRKLDRLYRLTGLSDIHFDGPRALLKFLFIHLSPPLTLVVGAVSVILVLVVAGGPILLLLARRHFPTPLEWFALASTCLVTAMFLWPSEFYYHFAAFLAPFLALAIALPLTRIIEVRRTWVTASAALVIAVFAIIQVTAERGLQPTVPAPAITAAARLIPPGSCVVSDTTVLLQLANRFNSAAPGCSDMVDGLGTDLALSRGLTPETGAGAVASVARTWRQAIGHAQYLWLSAEYTRRIPVTAALSSYLHHDFRLIYADDYGDKLYRRTTSSAVTVP